MRKRETHGRIRLTQIFFWSGPQTFRIKESRVKRKNSLPAEARGYRLRCRRSSNNLLFKPEAEQDIRARLPGGAKGRYWEPTREKNQGPYQIRGPFASDRDEKMDQV